MNNISIDPHLVTDIFFTISLILLLMYMSKKDTRREKILDKRYNDLTERFIETTIDFNNTLIEVIKTIPIRQKQFLQEISDQYIETELLMVEELKSIESFLKERYTNKI